MPVVHTYYYTDPACPWSWAMEPAVRKLTSELGESLQITYVMCGMAREFGDGRALALTSLSAADASGMPVDARLWLESPPRSSHPACIAVKAAAEQADPGSYLRRVREGLMCRRRKLDAAEALVEEARLTGGLDVERFEVGLRSHGTLEAFGADLDRAKGKPLPSFEFVGADDVAHGVYGYSDYQSLLAAAERAGVAPRGAAPPSIEEALRAFGTMATAELAAVCELPGPRAAAELWRLASEWRITPERLGSGELWTLA